MELLFNQGVPVWLHSYRQLTGKSTISEEQLF